MFLSAWGCFRLPSSNTKSRQPNNPCTSLRPSRLLVFISRFPCYLKVKEYHHILDGEQSCNFRIFAGVAEVLQFTVLESTASAPSPVMCDSLARSVAAMFAFRFSGALT